MFHNPISRTLQFNEQSTRAALGLKRIWMGLKDIIQTDGFGVYKQYGARHGVSHLGCLIHVRWGFERALDSDLERAGQASQENLDPSPAKSALVGAILTHHQ